MSTYIQEIRQALAVTITEEDIKVLVNTTRKKALQNITIAAELKALPDNNGKATFDIKHYYSLYQLWRIILLGIPDPGKPMAPALPFISLDTSIPWLRIIFNTLDKNFSGEIAEVGKINALHYFNLFVCDAGDDLPPAKCNHFTINCAAQILLCCSLASYWLNVSSFLII